MNLKFLFLAVFLLALAGCASKGGSQATTGSSQASVQHSGTGTLVIKPIRFNKNAYIREAVKQQCNLKGKLSQFIDQYAASQYAKIIVDSRSVPAGAEVLSIEIEQVQGGAGGAWSGGKSVLINGKLQKNGRLIGDFKGHRYSGGGMFGAYKGTCAILGRCVKALGRDIAEWLRNPTPKAVLGDM